MKLVTFDEWTEEYKPIKNPLKPEGSFNGTMFETYGADWAEVISADPDCVWTYKEESGNGSFIVSGIGFVNRVGYFITEKPRNEDNDLIVVLMTAEALQ